MPNCAPMLRSYCGKSAAENSPLFSTVLVPGFFDRDAAQVNLGEVGCSQSCIFGHEQMIIAKMERLDPEHGSRIFIAHHCSSDRIGGNRIESGDEDARAGELQLPQLVAPWAFAAAHRGDAINDREVNRPRGAD